MKNVLANTINWYKRLSVTKKVVFGLVGIFFILPLTLSVLMFILMLLFIFIPFIALIAAVVLLIISFIKKNDAKNYRISSLISLVIAFVSVFVINAFLDSDSEINDDTNKDAIVLESDSNDSSESDLDVATSQVDESKHEVEAVVAPVINEGKIHFINTGNSDAILIENNSKFAMIDR